LNHIPLIMYWRSPHRHWHTVPHPYCGSLTGITTLTAMFSSHKWNNESITVEMHQ